MLTFFVFLVFFGFFLADFILFILGSWSACSRASLHLATKIFFTLYLFLGEANGQSSHTVVQSPKAHSDWT